MSVKIRTEFSVAVPHRPGELARILQTLSKGGVNVLGFCGWSENAAARVLVVSDDDRKARKALADAKYASTEAPVVCVTGSSGQGAGAKLTLRLAKTSTNIDHAYATTSGTGESSAIFRVSDPQAALEILLK
jgi:hypothetical protein